LLSLFTALLLLGAAASSVEAANPKGALPVPIAGVGANTTFYGVLNITGFAVQNGVLGVVGNLVGTLTNTQTGVVTTIIKALFLPLATPTATCDILHLELGPLDLNLLGVVVHLNQVVLDIDAVSGPGNLLGNLLCSVAHLLDGGNLNALANLLNQLLGSLLGT
jgi:hypothetical protein